MHAARKLDKDVSIHRKKSRSSFFLFTKLNYIINQRLVPFALGDARQVRRRRKIRQRRFQFRRIQFAPLGFALQDGADIIYSRLETDGVHVHQDHGTVPRA